MNTAEVLLPINHKNYNFREKKNSQVIRKGKFTLHVKDRQRRRKLFHVALKSRLADLNYNFECDRRIRLTCLITSLLPPNSDHVMIHLGGYNCSVCTYPHARIYA